MLSNLSLIQMDIKIWTSNNTIYMHVDVPTGCPKPPHHVHFKMDMLSIYFSSQSVDRKQSTEAFIGFKRVLITHANCASRNTKLLLKPSIHLLKQGICC